MTAAKGDVIVNFNYDYYFLSTLFPSSLIIHIVNDDFLIDAIRPNRKSAARLQSRTASDAYHTLCVSYALAERTSNSNPECSVFLPWARRRYVRPPLSADRNEILYWGYINERLDFEVVNRMLDSGTRINFFGQITPGNRVNSMLSHPNAKHFGKASLEDIPNILLRCCSTLLPYDPSYGANKCITMGNRGFELLSFGLPLIVTDLPNLILAPDNVIFRCSSAAEFIAAQEYSAIRFEELQTEIEKFLTAHYANNRYQQFMQILAESGRIKSEAR
jgi:hypothetical protein